MNVYSRCTDGLYYLIICFRERITDDNQSIKTAPRQQNCRGAEMVYAEQWMLLSALLQIPHKLFSYPDLRAAVRMEIIQGILLNIRLGQDSRSECFKMVFVGDFLDGVAFFDEGISAVIAPDCAESAVYSLVCFLRHDQNDSCVSFRLQQSGNPVIGSEERAGTAVFCTERLTVKIIVHAGADDDQLELAEVAAFHHTRVNTQFHRNLAAV